MQRTMILFIIFVMALALIGGCCPCFYEDGSGKRREPWTYRGGDGMVMPRDDVQFNN
jgi:hypothetical protein